MVYITTKRFNKKAICGIVDIPQSTKCECIDNIIYYEKYPLCYITSENAHQFFSRNDDGNGLLRGQLIQKIQKTLSESEPNEEGESLWDKIMENPMCQSFKRIDHEDFWLWNHEFFNADIESLRYIANLIGIEE